MLNKIFTLIRIRILTKISIKIVILLSLSMLIHFLPNWLHFSWVEIIAPNSESIFQHERILFAAYFIYSLVEYFIIRKNLSNRTNFWMARFLILLLLPWIMVMVYLVPQAFTGKMPNEGWEVFWAILSTFLVWLTVVFLEKDLEAIHYSKKASVVIIILFLLLVLSNTIFTYKLPVYDIFVQPVTLY